MKRRIVIAVILGVALLPMLLLAVRSAMATRPENLGVTDGQLSACPASPNCVSSQAEDAEHQIDAIRFAGEAAAAMSQLREAVAALPRTQIVTEEGNYLHAESTSLLFRFVDDVEFVLDVDQGVIHVRSASRTGYSDMGVNRARVESIRASFDAG